MEPRVYGFENSSFPYLHVAGPPPKPLGQQPQGVNDPLRLRRIPPNLAFCRARAEQAEPAHDNERVLDMLLSHPEP